MCRLTCTAGLPGASVALGAAAAFVAPEGGAFGRATLGSDLVSAAGWPAMCRLTCTAGLAPRASDALGAAAVERATTVHAGPRLEARATEVTDTDGTL